jgi:hypothetical protein
MTDTKVKVVRAMSVGGTLSDPAEVYYRVTWDGESWYEYILNGYHARRADFVFAKSKSQLKYAQVVKKTADSVKKF